MSAAKLTKPQLARLREIEQGPSYLRYSDRSPRTTAFLVDAKLVARGRRTLSMASYPVTITDAGRAVLADPAPPATAQAMER